MIKLLITGICGFVGSTLAKGIREAGLDWTILGVDNLIRRGSETNVDLLKHLGVQLIHADLRAQSDVDAIPEFDWIIDAAANPSVLAGSDGKTSSRQLMEHNLFGTLNMLERCKAQRAGFILLSTSRVYSIQHLSALPVRIIDDAFHLDVLPPKSNLSKECRPPTVGLTSFGITEDFPTSAPLSLYGTSKLASEALALEYGATFDFPVWINRCGVLAGAGQFGRPDQGIFAYWINAYLRRRPLKYIGFGGDGYQVRDCLHPRDVLDLIRKQINEPATTAKPRISNVSGGLKSAISLKQLTAWCDAEFGSHSIASDPTPRPFDLPWVVLDSSQAQHVWNWSPSTSRDDILKEISVHAHSHPNWLSLSV